jgi:hypothetical protein
MTFNKWFDTFIEEKGIDLDQSFEIEGKEWGINIIPVAVIVEHIKIANVQEQKQIKDIIVKIDFANGDVMDFFKHLATVIAR